MLLKIPEERLGDVLGIDLTELESCTSEQLESAYGSEMSLYLGCARYSTSKAGLRKWDVKSQLEYRNLNTDLVAPGSLLLFVTLPFQKNKKSRTSLHNSTYIESNDFSPLQLHVCACYQSELDDDFAPLAVPPAPARQAAYLRSHAYPYASAKLTNHGNGKATALFSCGGGGGGQGAMDKASRANMLGTQEEGDDEELDEVPQRAKSRSTSRVSMLGAHEESDDEEVEEVPQRVKSRSTSRVSMLGAHEEGDDDEEVEEVPQRANSRATSRVSMLGAHEESDDDEEVEVFFLPRRQAQGDKPRQRARHTRGKRRRGGGGGAPTCQERRRSRK